MYYENFYVKAPLYLLEVPIPLIATTPASPATETADTKYYIKMG